MNKKPSHPGALPSNDTAASGTHETPCSAIKPRRRVSAALAFSEQAQEIRAVRGNTGAIAVRKILGIQLSDDSVIKSFPEETRESWMEIIASLMITAKSALEDDMPVDFYVKFRELKDEEEKKPLTEKLLFIPRLSSWLSGKHFSLKEGATTSSWKVSVCNSEDLMAAAPILVARNETTGQFQQVQLVHIMAGLKIF